jgi:hypothetical protein
MTENRGPDPPPPSQPSPSQPPLPQPPPSQSPSRPPPSRPPEDDIRWLVYLAVGFVVVLALLLLSGLHASHMGH